MIDALISDTELKPSVPENTTGINNQVTLSIERNASISPPDYGEVYRDAYCNKTAMVSHRVEGRNA